MSTVTPRGNGMLRRLPAERTTTAVAAALGLTVVASLVMLPLRGSISEGAVALVLLLPPLLAAVAGLRAGLVCALVGAGTFTVLFTRPYDSPRVESTASAAAVVVYVVVVAALAVALDRLRAAARASRRRARQLEVINGLSESLLGGAPLDASLAAALEDVRQVVPVRGLALHVPGDGVRVGAGLSDEAERGAAGMASPASGRLRTFTLGPSDDSVGLLVVDPGDTPLEADDRQLLVGMADVIGLGVARGRLERERVRREALEETDRLREALARSVTHDLRTPVAAIRAAAGALRDVHGEELRSTLLDDIEREGQRLTHLVTNMLDLSRIRAGALRLRYAEVPLGELLHEAVAAVPGSEGRVRVTTGDDLPVVRLDESLMRQVLVNLVHNAVLHTTGPVEVAGAVDDSWITVAVTDHGPGIPAHLREAAFEPHNRLDTTAPGSGLGLAICRGYITAHGGRIAITDTPGGGATVTAGIPR
ncbi:MAG: ATP-binding protein [Thermoleophilia bacterium]